MTRTFTFKNKVRKLRPRNQWIPLLVSKITRKPRKIVTAGIDFHWSGKLWTHNVFRIFELVIGAPGKIKPSVASWMDEEGGQYQAAYTFEAQIALFEAWVRSFKKEFAFEVVRIPQLQFAGMQIQGIPPMPYMLAIAHDADSGATNNSTPLTHVITGSNTLLIAGTTGDNSDNLSGLTYNSVSMTLAVKLNYTADRWNYLHSLIAPTTGSNSIAVTGLTYKSLMGVSYTGCAQSSVIDTTYSQMELVPGTTSTATMTVTASNCWLLGGVYAPGSVAGTGGSVVRTTDIGSMVLFDSNTTVGTGSQSISVTNGNFARLVLGLAFKPVITDLAVSVSDSLTITESVTMEITSSVNVNDAVTITESVTMDNSQLGGISVSDAITVTDVITGLEFVFIVSVFDAVTITESVTMDNSQLGDINVNDAITITESITVANSQLGDISVSDSITITESITVDFTFDISVSDNITISEDVQMQTSMGDISVFDAITITESVTMFTPDQLSGIAIMRSNQQQYPLGMDDNTIL